MSDRRLRCRDCGAIFDNVGAAMGHSISFLPLDVHSTFETPGEQRESVPEWLAQYARDGQGLPAAVPVEGLLRLNEMEDRNDGND